MQGWKVAFDMRGLDDSEQASPAAEEPASHDSGRRPSRWRGGFRIAWTIASVFLVESVIFGLSALPAGLFWEWTAHWGFVSGWIRMFVLSMMLVPAYFLFAVSLMVLSAAVMRTLGWRTPANAELRLADLDWPLLNWVRYAVSTHLVGLFAGRLFRSTQLWSLYLRLNGARMGRGVFVNSLSIMDHCLLDLGDHVVIGSDVHLSGHTVEQGVVKTAPVRIGANVTVGVGSVIGIGVEIGPDCQVGALSVVPKFRVLEAGGTYAGVPVSPVPQSVAAEVTLPQPAPRTRGATRREPL